jgi:hypothetical protein
MGFLAYQLLYIQLPLIVFPFPKTDFRQLVWVDNSPSIGLYSYNDSLLAQFETQKYINRSILGEKDFFLISGQEKYDSVPASYLRVINGDYKLLQFHFDRKLDCGNFSGGLLGMRGEMGTGFKVYGTCSLPFIFNGNISASAYNDILNFSLNCDHLFFETTTDEWFGYLKFGDARVGVTHDDREFVSYLFRPRDPIFLIMTNFVGKGLFGEGNFEMEDYYIAPLYVLSLDNSIYCIISENPAVGFKSKYGGFEIGQDDYLLMVNTNFFKAFVDYSFNDLSWNGAFEGKLGYSFYDRKIIPGFKGTFYDNKKFDFELSLKILEVKFFWAITGVTFEGYYDRQYWGMDMIFSF